MRLRVSAKLVGDPTKRIPAGVARGLNEGGDLVRTQVRRALKAQTGVKAYRSITSRTAEAGKGYNRAAPGRLHYVVPAKSRAIPIDEFPVKVVTGPGGGVDAKTWGVDHLFKRSFAKKGQGIAGARARLPASEVSKDMPKFGTRKDGTKVRLAGRFPLRKLKGPNLAKELTKGESAATFHRAVGEVVAPAVLKQLAKALS